jgi:hypothetical protein
MPPTPATNAFLAAVGNKIDPNIKAHALDEPNFGFQRLPAPIKRGVAKLTEVTFAQYKTGDNVGKWFCRMAGVVITPKTVPVNGVEVSIEGLQTSQQEPICDTQGTRDGKKVTVTAGEHAEKVMNLMKTLGADPGAFTQGAKSLVLVGEALKAAQPFFWFSTSVRPARDYMDPKTNKMVKGEEGTWENWHGCKGLEDYTPPDDSDVTVTVTGGEAAEPATETSEAGEGVPPEDNDPATTGGFGPDRDLDSLVKRASKPLNDVTAQETLTQMAKDAGASEDDIENAADWDAVKALIEAGSTTAEPEPEPPQEPKKGEVWKWKPIDAKSGKPGKRVVDVTIVRVDGKASKVDLERHDTKAIVKNIPFADVTPS